jgi:hypothetical protein
MSNTSTAPEPTVIDRALQSAGVSEGAIYRAVAEALVGRHPGGGLLLDIGCGTGNLWRDLSRRFDRYVGADAVHDDGLPADLEFCPVHLDAQRVS